MLNESKNCVCCNKLTDNKNKFGFVCVSCANAVKEFWDNWKLNQEGTNNEKN